MLTFILSAAGMTLVLLLIIAIPLIVNNKRNKDADELPQEACLGTIPLALGLSHRCAFGSDSGLGEPFFILEPLLVLFHLFLWLPRILWLAHWPPLLCVWTSSSPCDSALRA